MTDIRRWITYNPLDPLWDFQPATSALQAKTQAGLIVLRYRDHHLLPIDEAGYAARVLTEIAQAIRNLPCSDTR